MTTKREHFCRWLGRDQLPGKLDHYTLLGIERQQATPTNVTQRAKQLLAQVQQHDPGELRPFWLELQHRIVAAHKCLQDPKAKTAYDASWLPPPAAAAPHLPPSVPPTTRQTPPLPQKGAPAVPAELTAPIPTTTPPPDAPNRLPTVHRTQMAREVRRRHRNSTVGCLLATICSIVLLGVTGLVVLLYLDRNPLSNNTTQWTFKNPIQRNRDSTDHTSPDQPPAASMRLAPVSPHTTRPATPVRPDPPQVVSLPGQATAEPQQAQLGPAEAVAIHEDDEPLVEPVRRAPDFRGNGTPPDSEFTRRDAQVLAEALTRARSNLGLRKWSSIHPHLERAKKTARLPEHHETIARLQRLHYYVTEFWQAVREGLAMLDGGMEMPVQDSVVMVVEASDEQLILRVNGKNHTFRLDQIPGKLAMVLADQWFNQEAASTPLIRGAFMAVDPDFDQATGLAMIRSTSTTNRDVQDLLQAVAETYDFQADVSTTE